MGRIGSFYYPTRNKDSKWLNSEIEDAEGFKENAALMSATALNFDTLEDAINSESLYEGGVVVLKERTAGYGGGATWDVVLTENVTPNGFDVVQCVGDASLSIVLRVVSSTYNVDQMGAKDTEYSDDCLQYIISLLSEGDCVIGNAYEYKFLSQLRLYDIPYYTSFKFVSNLVFGDTGGVLLKSRNVYFEALKIDTTAISVNVGLTVEDSRSCTINVREMYGWHTCVLDKSITNRGCFNNRLTIKKTTAISDNMDDSVCLLIEADGSGFVNEEYFQMGYMTGSRGIWFRKGPTQTNEYDGNKLDRCQFEDIYYRSLELEFCSICSIVLPRFEGGNIPSDYIIYEHSDCFRMWYEVPWPLRWDKVKLDGLKGTYYGNIVSLDGVKVISQMKLGGISKDREVNIASEWSDESLPNTMHFRTQDGDKWGKWLCSVTDGSGNHRYAGLLNPIGEDGVSSVSGDYDVQERVSFIDFYNHPTDTTNLIMPSSKEINGHSILLISNIVDQNVGDLVVYKSDKSSSVTGMSSGLYHLIYSGSRWIAVKMAEVSDVIR